MALQGNYDQNADAYAQFLATPLGTLEQQLFDIALKDCSGLRVLDLGGGSGLRARDALKGGARVVDVVDISPEMMRIGKEYERSIGRESINWYCSDVSKSLDHLSLGLYDLVIANGIFDHAHDVEELEAMWRNAAIHVKPKGCVVANRNNPSSKAATEGKYGVYFNNFKEIPGGFSYDYNMQTTPPLRFQSMALETYSSGSLHIPGQFFAGFQNVPWTETPIVKAGPSFWATYLEDPILYIFTASRKERGA